MIQQKTERRPYRGFDIFIYGGQGVRALEGSHPRGDEEILILYRMALQLCGAEEVKMLGADNWDEARDPRDYGV